MASSTRRKRKLADIPDNESEKITKSPGKSKKTSHATLTKKKTYTTQKIELKEEKEGVLNITSSLPKRNKLGKLVFDNWPEFQPTLTPKEVLQAGSFGGTYFRPIKSGVTGETYDSSVWEELPKDWLEGLNVKKQVSSAIYDENVNTYKVKCGGSLQMWEESGWIHQQDPYGWFQWYCRFYQGRRSVDDERQIGRWLRCTGPKGRWKNNLITKCYKSGRKYNDISISPVVRQTLQHWAYALTEADFNTQVKILSKKGV